MFNLHTHTTRCNHARSTDEEYVLAAIRNGYDMMGFSDHVPYLFPNDYYSGMRMLPSETQEYVDSIRHLQEKYKDNIDIKLGFEVEWYPELIEKEMEFLKSFDYDYLILAQHFTENEFESYSEYTGAKTDSVKTLDKYISQILDGARSGYFTYVCHPDLINFVGDEKIYTKKITDMLIELKKLEIPLEYNFYGFFENRHYPADRFWKIAKKVGNPVVIGLDAHWCEVYDDRENFEKMKEHLNDLGIKPIERIELR